MSINNYNYFINNQNPDNELVKLAFKDIMQSGLFPEIIEQANIKIFNGTEEELKNKTLRNALPISFLKHKFIEIPYFNEKGNILLCRFKIIPSPAKEVGTKKNLDVGKYLHPTSVPAIPYIFKSVWDIKESTNTPIWITEGEKKALKLIQHGRPCIGISGVWNFHASRNTKETSSVGLWQEIKQFKLKGRTIYIAFDSDIWTNINVRQAIYELAFKLYKYSGNVKIISWDHSLNLKGIDDYLAAQDDVESELKKLETHSLGLFDMLNVDYHDEILRAIVVSDFDDIQKAYVIETVAKLFKVRKTLIRDALTEISKRIEYQNQKYNYTERMDKKEEDYFIKDGALWRRNFKIIKDQIVDDNLKLANFDIKIKKRIIEDDGVDKKHMLLLGGSFFKNGKTFKLKDIEVEAYKFEDVARWKYDFQSELITEPQRNTKDYIRHAIEVRSEDIKREVVFTHTGWRLIENEWFYLSGSSAVGNASINTKIEPGLSSYELPDSVDVDEKEAIRASMGILNIGSEYITLPIFLTTYLAPLTTLLGMMPNFTLYLHGATGTFKSTTALLALTHFGNFNNIQGLPNFDDTTTDAEIKSFILKDTLMVLDDFFPSQNQADARKREAVAQSIIRKASNRSARGRRRTDLKSRAQYYPRGMVMITGEVLPSLESTIARIMIVEFNKKSINLTKLNEISKKRHLLKYSMLNYIKWVKLNMKNIQDKFDSLFYDLRNKFNSNGFHSKTTEQLSFLMFTSYIVSQWLIDNNIFNKEESETFLLNIEATLSHLTTTQQEFITEEDPAVIFLSAIKSLLEQRKVKFINKFDGKTILGDPLYGSTIGYYDEDYIYMRMTSAYNEVCQFFIKQGGFFPLKRKGIIDMMFDKGIIVKKNVAFRINLSESDEILKAHKIPIKYLFPKEDKYTTLIDGDVNEDRETKREPF